VSIVIVRNTQVLLADDSARARGGLRALLSLWPGVTVVAEAATGPDAIRAARDRQPDVVIMDVRMPNLDGLETTRIIKTRWPEITVVVLSVCASHRAGALSAGADAFLVKGCPTAELISVLSRCLQAVAEARPAPASRCAISGAAASAT
jgi:DNA-binding NarL/FixJ family response regulator